MDCVSIPKKEFPNIHNLLYYLHDITQVHVKLVTPDSTIMSASNPDSICNSFFCNVACTLKKCERSSSLFFDNFKLEECTQTDCMNGFSNIVFPVRTGGRLICVIALCGFFFDDELERRDEMLLSAISHGFDSQKFQDVLLRTPVIERAEAEYLIKKCTPVVKSLKDAIDHALITQKKSGSIEKNILEAIEKNISIKDFMTDAQTSVVSIKSLASNKKYKFDTESILNFTDFYAVIIISDRGMVKHANECAVKMFGLPDAATINHNLWDLLPEDISFKRKMFVAIALHDKKRQAFEEKIGERYFETEISFGPWGECDEEILVIGSREVTDFKKTGIEYLKVRAKLSDFFENSPNSYAVLDFTDLKKHLASLSSSENFDICSYFFDHDKELERCIKMMKIKEVNNSAVSLFKSSTKEKLINNIEKCFAAESKMAFMENLVSMSKNNLSFEKELYMQNFEGQKIAVKLTRSELDNDNTSLVTLIDITARKKLESKLFESLERYRAIFDYSVECIALGEADTGIIVDCNQSFSALLEYDDKSEIIGRHQKTIHPVEENTDGFTRSFKKRSQIPYDRNPLRRQIITKSGAVKDVSITTSAFEINGKKYIQGTFKDLTEEFKYAKNIKDYESVIKGIHDNISIDVGERYLERLLNNLNNIIKAEFIYIGKYIEDFSKISVVASCKEVTDDFSPLDSDSEPCKNKNFESGVFIIENVYESFPDSKIIKYFDAKEYAGISIYNSEKKLIGVMSAYFRQPVENKKLLDIIFNMFSIRVGSELERIDAENIIKKSEERYRTIFYNSSFPMVEMNCTKLKEKADAMKKSGVDLKSYYTGKFDELRGLVKLISVNRMNLNANKYFETDVISEFEAGLPLLFTDRALTFFLESLIAIGAGKTETSDETIFKIKNGEEKNIILNLTKLPSNYPYESTILASFIDITDRKRAEDELRVKDFAIESSLNAIAISNLDGILNYVNPSFLKIWGYGSMAEVIGKSVVSFWQMGEKALEVIDELRADGKWSGEMTAKRRNGDSFNVQVAANMIWDVAGRPVGMLGSFFDITDRKQAENALAFNNIILRTQLGSSIDGMLVVDEKGEILSFNQRFTDMWGIASDVIESKSDERALQSVMNKLSNPEEFMRKVKYLYEARYEISMDEIELKDGGTFERYSAPMIGADGKYYGRVWYFRDITDRKRAEKIIIDSEMKLKKIFASINDSIIIADLSGNILEINEYACKKLKYEKEELLKKNIRDINSQYHLLEIGDRLKNIMASGKAIYESHYVTKDGYIFPVEIKTSMTEFMDKPALIAIVRDISERVNIENALLESEKRYHELVEMSSEGFWVTDNNWNTIYMNNQMADMIGYTVAEIGNRNVSDFIHEDSITSFVDNFSEMLHGSIRQNEVLFKHKNGKKIFAIISLSFLTDREGNTTGRFALVTDITERVELEKQFELVKKEISKNYTLGDIVGKSKYMRSVFEMLPAVSECDSNIMIEGPSGTGKSLIARTAHNLSSRREGPFIVVNCGSLPETLLESEFFGYVKGAFTDAKKDKPGKFMMADKGTIFLDEIGEMPMHLQVKLLRVIEEKIIEPLGSNKTMKVDFRLIAATNKNLKSLVSEGKFREDLYYRLRVAYFNIPPLRERREDIDLLVNSFFNKLNAKYNKNINGFSNEVLVLLKCYDFPGNARELYNMLEYAYILCKNGSIKLNDLPEEYTEFYKQITGNKLNENTAPSKITVNDYHISEKVTTCKVTNCKNDTLCKLDEISKESLIEILTKHKFNKGKTAKALNTSRMTLWRLMKKFDITD